MIRAGTVFIQPFGPDPSFAVTFYKLSSVVLASFRKDNIDPKHVGH
jgi:hypothetical protein